MASLVRIDQYWDEVSQTEDLARFREQDVEILLDQAADLLDRILREQDEFDNLGEKLFEIEMLEEEMRSRASGVAVDLPTSINPPFVTAPKSLVMADITGEALREEYEASLDQLVPLDVQGRNFANLRKFYGDPPIRNAWVESSGFAAAGTNNPNDSRYQGAKQVREQEMLVLDEQTSASQQEFIALRNSALKHARASAFKRAYDVESTKLNDRLKKLKANAARQPKHSLNFEERRLALQARIDHDFNEVKARVSKAAAGLKTIYQYTGDLPLKDSRLGLYDRYLISVRQAISYLVGITRRDQLFVTTISLKNLLQDKWAQGLATAKWDFEFTASQIDFPSYYYLTRLRGAALSVVYQTLDLTTADIWTGDIEVTTANTTARCHAGRIAHRQPLREPDLLGEVLLHNIDPFPSGKGCRWTVSINPKSLLGQRLGAVVQDVLLDLRIVAQVKAGV